jgi:cytochrome bd-type quinol oxidase subunit 2
MSTASRLMLGIILLTVPTVIYGGLTVLGIVTAGAAGLHPRLELRPPQQALFRAMHAHAGVLVILSLLVQVLADGAALPHPLEWTARVAAPLAAIAVPGGFAWLAFARSGRRLLYVGATLLIYATVVIAIGLLRSL